MAYEELMKKPDVAVDGPPISLPLAWFQKPERERVVGLSPIAE